MESISLLTTEVEEKVKNLKACVSAFEEAFTKLAEIDEETIENFEPLLKIEYYLKVASVMLVLYKLKLKAVGEAADKSNEFLKKEIKRMAVYEGKVYGLMRELGIKRPTSRRRLPVNLPASKRFISHALSRSSSKSNINN